MPTPFYHLSIAEELLEHPELNPNGHRILENQPCSFLFGNTAPDVQVVSHQPREATHFFSLPFQKGAEPAWERFLKVNPSLARLAELSPAQAAFIAGYLCHLQADWLWIKEIFAPIFGPDLDWGSFANRLYIHNVLRAYMDQGVIAALPRQTYACLANARPDHWLPFVEDVYLREWRDFLAVQLKPGASVQTVEVFSRRAGISPEDFYALLGSEKRMNQEVFAHVSREQLTGFRETLIHSNIDLLNAVWIAS